MTPELKKRVKEARKDFDLHVALIVRDEVGKTDAIVLAYAEGKAGLLTRLNPIIPGGSK